MIVVFQAKKKGAPVSRSALIRKRE